MGMKKMDWVNGKLVLSGPWTTDEFKQVMEAYNEADSRNKEIIKSAEALVKAVMLQFGYMDAIKEVYHYIDNHKDYEKFGPPFGLNEAKEIVDYLLQA